MKKHDAHSNRTAMKRLALCAVVLCAIVAVPLLSGARTHTATNAINIVNNSGWEIRHLYISSVDQDNWSDDQLNSVISPGASYMLTATCNDSQIKVISEDQDGCFLSHVVSCADNATWTITNSETPNCGN